jgi:hypothetical protein
MGQLAVKAMLGDRAKLVTSLLGVSFADRVLRPEDACMAHEWVPTETADPSEPMQALTPERLRFLKEQVA